MFKTIAPKYDLLNNLMTFGFHKQWKRKTIKLALKECKNPCKVLDLCAGTGDLALMLRNHCPDTHITIIDNCNEMLNIAENKIKKLNTKNITIKHSNCENIETEQDLYDLVTIGFGLRNLINKEKCLSNVYKLLSRNGVFACIDLGHPTNPFWAKLFNFYFFKVVPRLGEIFACNKEAYTYLPESLIGWYKQEELKNIILQAGFKKCFYKNIMGGIVAIHIAVK